MVLLLLKVGSTGVSVFSVISGMISVASFLNICHPCTEWDVICVRTQTAHTAQGICMVTDQLFSTWQPQILGKGTLFPFLKSLLEPSQPMTIHSGKGQTTHSSQLLSVWNKMGVWGWLSDNILQLLCKNFTYLPHFGAWQQKVIDKATMKCNLMSLSAVFLTMAELKPASACIHIWNSGYCLFQRFFRLFTFCCCCSSSLCLLYKVSKSRNCSSVILLFSLCREMIRVRVAFFLSFPKQGALHFVPQIHWKKQGRASFQYEKLLCLLFLKNSLLGMCF